MFLFVAFRENLTTDNLQKSEQNFGPTRGFFLQALHRDFQRLMHACFPHVLKVELEVELELELREDSVVVVVAVAVAVEGSSSLQTLQVGQVFIEIRPGLSSLPSFVPINNGCWLAYRSVLT